MQSLDDFFQDFELNDLEIDELRKFSEISVFSNVQNFLRGSAEIFKAKSKTEKQQVEEHPSEYRTPPLTYSDSPSDPEKKRNALDYIVFGIQFALRNLKYSSDLSEKVESFSQDIKIPFRSSFFRMEIFSDLLFHRLRLRENITNSSFANSLDLEISPSVFSEGKSKSFFLISSDRSFILKTISQNEKRTFVSMIEAYYEKMLRTSWLLRVYFFGQCRGLNFIIFNNLFIEERKRVIYDLKGSLVDRKAKKGQMVLRDQDFIESKRKIHLGDQKSNFMSILTEDAKFLNQFEIMDYSLLIGISPVDPSELEEIKNKVHKASLSSPPGQIFLSTEQNELYEIGVIDHFTPFGLEKTLAHNFKGLMKNKNELSTVKPDFYCSRFLKFIDSIID